MQVLLLLYLDSICSLTWKVEQFVFLGVSLEVKKWYIRKHVVSAYSFPSYACRNLASESHFSNKLVDTSYHICAGLWSFVIGRPFDSLPCTVSLICHSLTRILQNNVKVTKVRYFLCSNDVLVSYNFQLGSGFVIAEEKLSPDSNLSKLFLECKDYIIATCQGITWTEKVDDICQVRLYFVQLTICYLSTLLDYPFFHRPWMKTSSFFLLFCLPFLFVDVENLILGTMLNHP